MIFSKKSFESPEMPFDPKAWEAMERKLDNNPSFLSSRWINNLMGLAGIGVLLFLFLNNNTANKAALEANNIKEEKVAINSKELAYDSQEPTGVLQERNNKELPDIAEADADSESYGNRNSEEMLPKQSIANKNEKEIPAIPENEGQSMSSEELAGLKGEENRLQANSGKEPKNSKAKENNSLSRLSKDSKDVVNYSLTEPDSENGAYTSVKKPASNKVEDINLKPVRKEIEVNSDNNSVIISNPRSSGAMPDSLLLRQNDIATPESSVSISENEIVEENINEQILEDKTEIKIEAPLDNQEQKSLTEAEITENDQLRRAPFLSINFKLSPDISVVNLFGDKVIPGSNIGLFLEYYLSSRWRISAGVISSQKVYEVGQKSSYGYGSGNPNDLDRINAQCVVLDIPINLRYNFAIRPKGEYFISAGLSSYLMLSEDYDFQYKNANYNYSKSVKGENNHLFNIMNLSLGYERYLGKHFGLEVEPFVKAPINEIGYGNLKLKSLGTFLTLKYKLY